MLHATIVLQTAPFTSTAREQDQMFCCYMGVLGLFILQQTPELHIRSTKLQLLDRNLIGELPLGYRKGRLRFVFTAVWAKYWAASQEIMSDEFGTAVPN